MWSKRAVDPAAVAQYLVHEFVPQPRTILAGVRQSGRSRCAGASATASPASALLPRVRRSRAREHARARRGVHRARRRRGGATSVADVPWVFSRGPRLQPRTALAVRHHPRIKTFAIGFEDASFDESAHASAVARHLGTEHHTEVLSPDAMLDLLPSTLDWMDEPHADSSILPTTLLARLARRHVTVALGGDGGDEVLAGYPTFTVDQALRAVPPSPLLSRAVGALARLAPKSDANFSAAFKLRQTALGLGDRGAARHARWLSAVDPSSLPAMLSPALRDGAAHALDAALAAEAGTHSAFDAATAFYLGVYLSEGVLQKVDRATMRVSLEARAPLLDTAVVEFCLSLPESLRVRGATTKRLMRMALAPLVPPAIAARPKKGFGAPVGQWLRGPLRPMLLDALSPERVARGGWFEPAAVRALLDEHLAGRADHRKSLYALLVLERWRSRWLEAS
ncbi:MAG: asparagine synthase C-terminal domain-containing protein [Polyangiales bacterium]